MTTGSPSIFSSGYTLALDMGTVDIEGSGISLTATVCGGNAVSFQVDTGSNGIVMNASDLGADYTSYPCFGFGEMHYQPSDKILTGQWYLLPVSVGGKLYNGSTLVTGGSGVGMAMVLVTTGNTAHPAGSGMMGVAGKGQNPAFNLFLNMTGQITSGTTVTSVTLAPAYVLDVTDITDTGGSLTGNGTITIGKTYASGEGFGLIALQPVTPPPLPNQVHGPVVSLPALQAWAAPNIGIALINLDTSGGGTPNVVYMSGSLEIDTGLAQGIIAPTAQVYNILQDPYWCPEPMPAPGAPQPSGPPTITAPVLIRLTGLLESATRISLVTTSMSDLVAGFNSFSYTFGLNLTDAQETLLKPLGLDVAPTTLTLMQPGNWNPDTVRFNIGRLPLLTYTYMYDALNGVMAFKKKS